MMKFRIALGSNNGKQIVNAHFGDAASFYIYDIFEDNTIKFIEKRDNSARDEDESHGAEKKMHAVLKLINDSDVIISRKLSPNFKKIAKHASKQPLIIDLEAMEKILEKTSESFSLISSALDKKQENLKAVEILYI